MMHPDAETRVGAHQIFSIILVRNPTHLAHDGVFEARKFQTKTASAFANAAALLEKLRQEKELLNSKETDTTGAHCSIGFNQKSIPNICKISGPILDQSTIETVSC